MKKLVVLLLICININCGNVKRDEHADSVPISTLRDVPHDSCSDSIFNKLMPTGVAIPKISTLEVSELDDHAWRVAVRGARLVTITEIGHLSEFALVANTLQDTTTLLTCPVDLNWRKARAYLIADSNLRGILFIGDKLLSTGLSTRFKSIVWLNMSKRSVYYFNSLSPDPKVIGYDRIAGNVYFLVRDYSNEYFMGDEDPCLANVYTMKIVDSIATEVDSMVNYRCCW